MFDRLKNCIKDETTASGKLNAIFKYFESYVSHSDVKGGCPLMNAAIEADDANPVLRKGALRILDILHESVVTILKNGIRFKQIKKDIDLDYYATLIIASLEGAIMMSKLRGNNDDIRRVIKHLKIQLHTIEI